MIILASRSSTKQVATFFLATSIAFCLSSEARAQANVYRANIQAGRSHNAGDTNVITYTTAFVALSGGQSILDITDLQYGLRRIANEGNLTAVDVELFVAEMTWDGTNYGIGAPNRVQTESFAGGAGTSVTAIMNVTYPTGFARPNLLLETQSQPGFGGLFLGMRFLGPNATSPFNGWRTVQAPTVGSSLNSFFEYNIGSATLSAPLTTSPTIDNGQYRFYSTVVGNLIVVPEANTGLLALFGLAPVTGILIAKRRKKS